MFSVDVTETDAFYSLPLTAQALYFHLGMQGDDDGFVSNPRSIIRITGCSEQDLTVLVESGYIITFRTGVIVISDWKVNNYLRGDRHKPTIFQDEFSQLRESASRRYIFAGIPSDNQPSTIGIPSDNQPSTIGIPSDNQLSTIGIPSDNQLTTQNSIEENRVVESSRETAAPARTDTDLAQLVQHFQQVIGDFPRSALDKLQRWQEVFPVEIIQAAFDEAAENGVRKWRYVDGILKGWQADGVRTMGDVTARRESRKKPPEKEWKDLT